VSINIRGERERERERERGRLFLFPRPAAAAPCVELHVLAPFPPSQKELNKPLLHVPFLGMKERRESLRGG